MEVNNTIPLKTYRLLEAADWEYLGKKMLARALWRGSTRYGIHNLTTLMPEGYSLEDVPSYIIQSVFDGTRHWNPDEIELEVWVLGQVDSVLDWWLNLREKKDVPFEELESVDDADGAKQSRARNTEFAAVLRTGPPNSEDAIIARFDEETDKELINALYDDTSEIPELQELLVASMDSDDPKPKNIAQQLSISIEEIYVRNRRLKRHLERISKKMRKGIL